MRQTTEALLDGLLAAGYDMSLLFGIDDFYYRFGYVRAWSGRAFRVEVADLPDDDVGGIEVCTERYPDELFALYNLERALATGSAVRAPNPVILGQSVLHVWHQEGAVAGYVLSETGDEELFVREAVGQPNLVLGVSRRQAQLESRAVVEFMSLSAASTLARALRRGTCREIVDHRCNGGALARVVDLKAGLRKLAPELSRRLSVSYYAGWRGVLRLTSSAQSAHLELVGGVVRVIEEQHTAHVLEGTGVVQLLIGTDDPDEPMASGLVRPLGDAAMLARALFPAQHPMESQISRF